MEKFIQMKEVAEILEVHPATIARWCRKGDLIYYQIGARKRFLLADVEEFKKRGRRNDTTETETDPFGTSN